MLPPFQVASTASATPMNKGIQRMGGSVEATCDITLLMEDKKEVDKVILTGAELSKYFGKETTPREMKDQIIKLLDDWKGQQKEHEKPEKKTEKEK